MSNSVFLNLNQIIWVKDEVSSLFFLDDLLLTTLLLPLISLIFVYIASPLGNVKLYNISLFSSIISFIMSLLL
jgi:hypothetical protein